MIRMTGGLHRGRILKGPRGRNFRPTQGRIRETIFSVLGERVLRANALDLFAGSGAIGLEALSRGADSAVFVDQTPAHVAVIKQNIELLDFMEVCQVRRSDVFKMLKSMQTGREKYDLIFADPPYADGLHGKILDSLCKAQLLSRDGWLILEHGKGDVVNGTSEFNLIKTKSFGQTTVSFYEQSE